MSNTDNFIDMPYGEYVIEVDACMEKKYGRDTTQEELGLVDCCQTDGLTPSECADSIIAGQDDFQKALKDGRLP